MKQLLTRYHYLFLLVIVIIAFFLRFNNLSNIPNGLYQDETAIGYNAYSILTTGRDEYGKFLPIYFKSFGDQKLPVYIYATAISESIFGVNAFAVRFPSALFGVLTVFVFYFFVKQLTNNKNLAIIATTLLALNPWSLDYNRATFEVSICLFLFVAGGYLLLKSFEKRRTGLFLIATILFIVCLYSYNLTRLLSPVLFVSFLFLFRGKLKHISKLELLSTAIVSLVLLFPFASTIFGSGGASSASGTLLFSSNAVKAPLLEFRSYFIYHPLFAKFFLNTWTLLMWQYVNNIVSYFSTPFLFISGSTHGNHGIGDAGQFYLFEFPLIIAGAVIAIREKLNGWKLLIVWALATILVASLTRDIPQATRSIFLIVPMEIFSALGLIYAVSIGLKIKNNVIKTVLIVLSVCLAGYSMLFYFSSYYVRFPVLYAKQWSSEDKDLVTYLAQNYDNYDKIIFDTKAGFVYTSYLFYSKFDPKEFYTTVKRFPDDTEGFSRVQGFGKIEFKDVDWTTDYKTPRTLIVTNDKFKSNDIPDEKVFHFPIRPVVQSVGEVISSFPVEDTAYVVVKTK